MLVPVRLWPPLPSNGAMQSKTQHNREASGPPKRDVSTKALWFCIDPPSNGEKQAHSGQDGSKWAGTSEIQHAESVDRRPINGEKLTVLNRVLQHNSTRLDSSNRSRLVTRHPTKRKHND